MSFVLSSILGAKSLFKYLSGSNVVRELYSILVLRVPCFNILDNKESSKQVLAARVDTEDLDQSVSSATSACSPPPPLSIALPSLVDDSHPSIPLKLSATYPVASSLSAAGSPGQPTSPRDRIDAPSQPPTLPVLPKYRGAWDSSTSSPEDKKAESSVYYTTAWGSPYASHSPRRLSWSLSQYAGAERESGVSSPASVHSGIHHGLEPNSTDILKTSPLPDSPSKEPSQATLNRSPARDRLGRRGGKSIKDFTEDWINQYLSGQIRTERSNWLSDDSGSEAPSFFTAQNHFADDGSDDWLGLEQDNREEDLLKTPTLADFVNRRTLAGRREGNPGRQRVKETQHKRADTLRQEDFWGFAYDRDPGPITMTDVKEPQPSTELESNKMTPTEKPLPPPPVEASKDLPSVGGALGEPSEGYTPKTGKNSQLRQRQRKRIQWRGKGCIVDIPVDDKRGTEESGYRLLTAEDVRQRLRHWEELGYNTQGFRVCAPEDPSNIELGGLSRPSHPDPSDIQEEFQVKGYGVRIPNKELWDEYVNYLQEEKLRALGVSLGDIDAPPSTSPASAMNQMTPFPGLVSSPPIPTGSASSNPLSISHHLSPLLNQSANVSNGIGSLASPASQFSIQTPFMGVDPNVLHGYQIPFQHTPPTQGTLTPQSFFNMRQNGPASSMPVTLSNITSMLSPVSPLTEHGPFRPGFNDRPGDLKEGFDDQISHDMHDGFVEDQMLRPLRTPPPNLDNFHASNVEIAQPTPRGHSRGHNLSETLQKGIDQIPSDYHLEQSIDRQLDEGDNDPTHNSFDRTGLLQSRWALPETTNVVPHLPQQIHQFYGGGFAGDIVHEGSDIDTNPSLSGTPRRHGSLADHTPWHEQKQSAGSYAGGHRSKLSTSTLNVDAKEFDPSGSTSGRPLTFQDNSLQFSNPMFTFASGVGNKLSSGTFNVAAPSFTPGAGSSFNVNQETGHREFNFPSFNVAAPVFNPSNSTVQTSSELHDRKRTDIGDDIDDFMASKSSKKSKAIPIVRPDDTREDSNKREMDEKQDDNEDGGPVSTDRQKKRARHGHDASDRDRETRLSISNPLSETNNLQSSLSMSHVLAEGKENELPNQPTDVVNYEDLAHHEKPSDRRDTPVSEASTWTSFDQNQKAMLDTSDQTMQGTIHHKGPEPARDEDEPEPYSQQEKDLLPTGEGKQDDSPKDLVEEPVDASPDHLPLSPMDKSFNFKPSVAEFVPVFSDKPNPASKEAAAGLMASRYAVTSPPESPKTELPMLVSEPETRGSTENVVTQPEELSKDSVEQRQDSHSTDEEEIGAVMDQLNNNSDVGIERMSTPRPINNIPESVLGPSKEKRHVHVDIRSEPPSPSPGRGPVTHVLNVPKLDFDAESQFSATPSRAVASNIQSPIRQLINRNEHISDWDDMISSGEDAKLANRSRFFDRRINDLVGSAFEERLAPLERALGAIQQSLMSINTNPPNQVAWGSASAEVMDSDADDEDEEYEENASYRTRSPLRPRDRKLEKMRSVILEALASREPQPVVENRTLSELVQLRESFDALQTLTIQKFSEDTTTDLKEMVQEVIASQLKRDSRPSEAEEIGADTLMLQIETMKNLVRNADERADNEYKKRQEAQDSVSELQRLLKVAEEDAARHSAAAESAEARLLQLQEEKLPYFEGIQQKVSTLEKERETMRMTLDELSSKNISLQGTLDEYRVSSDNWKRESEHARGELDDVKGENQFLRHTIESLKNRIEDGLNIRRNLSEKLDRLQDEMVAVTRDMTRSQASWRSREEQQTAKYNELRASYNREMKLREQLEKDVTQLEEQEREAAKLKFIFGQSQQENARLEELVNDLRHKNHDLEIKAARFEREFNEARESSRIEIQRTRTSLETDLEAANSQVNIVRAELEAQVLRLQSQLDNVRLDNDTARERYEMLLEEAQETKASTFASAMESKEIAMEEQRKLHERVLNDLRERHARALHNSSEDRQRAEAHLMERLAFSDDKIKHLQERIDHLEDKLEIAQSAARAAAEAAQTAKAAGSSPAHTHSSSPSISFSKGSSVPEKISPQALRESILVLQDQLQQRETRIEELEQELSAVDKDAPNKLKENNTEIAWLRELLDVRLNDLQDIINTVSQPSFNQNAVRDAAIRLKANLQMQQQERERALTGQSFPSLPSLAELTASPRSLPLAAAAAWGNWRKGRDHSNSSLPEQTPSKSNNASSFLSGLLTPPSSNTRQTRPNGSVPVRTSWDQSSESRPLKNYNTTSRPLSSRATGKMREPPTTPPLLRRSSYDHDAEPTDYVGEDESTVDGLISASPKDTADGPFGPRIA